LRSQIQIRLFAQNLQVRRRMGTEEGRFAFLEQNRNHHPPAPCTTCSLSSSLSILPAAADFHFDVTVARAWQRSASTGPDPEMQIPDALCFGDRRDVSFRRLFLVTGDAKHCAVIQSRLSAETIGDYVIKVIFPERELGAAILAFALSLRSDEGVALNLF
jgi:hypothetical protein